MAKEIRTDIGKLALSEEAIATIAGAAATECYGVVGMAGRKMTDGISELLGQENLAKGVDVTIDGDDLYITLYVVLGYGVKIPEVARMVADKVRYTVENLTGLKVKKITVNVEGLRLQEDVESW
ncbi:MAG TPA: Asp23/Gls24 family envelope stress response protein [Bacillota bacterium]|nr:Asp23/Gls24 family envelope stress response protein [Candidatus Fermentithermobacillaceae bacterium]HOB30089.1 Asp23/Gls24 family envelope stress response protein [Bacillota bacterium]HOK63979.1 Asp23/Gls24 family envelope stress response protein [Bacillota bacterium]HOL11334.1 Asp23/Gls24 family envelope stress response protein [Bacillota bacterium]HOQ02463.1 Asp23/Gls24 family envelope stress response protein [Bacillota bacterium]